MLKILTRLWERFMTFMDQLDQTMPPPLVAGTTYFDPSAHLIMPTAFRSDPPSTKPHINVDYDTGYGIAQLSSTTPLPEP